MAKSITNSTGFITYTDGEVSRNIFKGNISAIKVNTTAGTITLNITGESSLLLNITTLIPGEGQSDWSSDVAVLKSTLITYILEYPYVTSPGTTANIVEFRKAARTFTLNDTHKTSNTTLGHTENITVYVTKDNSYVPGNFATLTQYSTGLVTVIFDNELVVNGGSISQITTDGIGSAIRLTKTGLTSWNAEKITAMSFVLPLVQGDLFTVDASLTIVKLPAPEVASFLKHSGEVGTSVFWDPIVEPAPEEPEEWTYEGVMTVGGDGSPGYSYVEGDSEIGSLNPTMSFNYDTGLIAFGDQTNDDKGLGIYFIDNDILVFSEDPITIQIDGVDYVINYNEDEGMHLDKTVTINPFPAVGQTCDIKLKYTLAEPEPEGT